MALVKFHWFGINWHVFMQKLLFVYYYSENCAKSGKYFQIWFSLDLGGGEMAAFWACACKLSWTLFSPARVQPLYGAGRKESSGTRLVVSLLFATKSQRVNRPCYCSEFMLGTRTCLPCHIPDRWSRSANCIWPDLAFGFVHKRSENEISERFKHFSTSLWYFKSSDF